MGLRAVVADPFRRAGRDSLEQSEFVVSLSLDRNWFGPDEAEQVATVAEARGLLERTDAGLSPTFDPETADPVAEDPSLDLDPNRPPFEVVLDRLGGERREHAAAINATQDRLGVDAPTAAVLHAHGECVDVDDLIDRLLAERGIELPDQS
jgi:hypothetical protein